MNTFPWDLIMFWHFLIYNYRFETLKKILPKQCACAFNQLKSEVTAIDWRF